MEEKDSLEEAYADATYVFGFVEGERPQPRAHRYLTEERAYRTGNDTAMEAACKHLMGRAYALGCKNALSSLEDLQPLAAKLTELSGQCLGAALEIRGAR